METEDDDIPVNNSPPDSQTSSIEGIYAAPSKTSHPFRIIEHDTMSLISMTSLGRVGRILAGGNDAASVASPIVPVTLTRDAQMLSAASIPNKDDDSVSGKLSQSSSVLTLSGDVVQDTGSVSGQDVFTSKCDSTVVLQEPDVIASTKNNSKTVDCQQDVAPVAPPRRKKKSKPQSPTDLAVRINLRLKIIFIRQLLLFL